MLKLTEKHISLFWEKVLIWEGEDTCWLWIGTKNKDGYGQIGYNNKVLLAHRVSYFIATGIDPDTLTVPCIRHTCDNPICVNPSHLIPGTRLENSNDARIRNRIPKGDMHWRGKRKLRIIEQMKKELTNLFE